MKSESFVEITGKLSGTMLMMVMLTTDASSDPIQHAIAHYQSISTYQAVIESLHAQSSEPDVIRYYYKKPGYVRMEVIAPKFSGAVLIYTPESRLIKVWLFGHGHFPYFSFSPENKLVQSPSGQRVDRSDLGAFFHNVTTLQSKGNTTAISNESIAGQSALHFEVEAHKGVSISGVSKFQLWLDPVTGFPLKVMSYKADGELIERVVMSDYKINPVFPVGFFDH